MDKRREIGGRNRKRNREGIEKGRAEIGDWRGWKGDFLGIFGVLFAYSKVS